MKKRLLAVLAIAVVAAALIAQERQEAVAPYIETFEVRLHNLDVIVTDRKGNPVPGLTKDDFEVLQDGVVQEITNFAEYAEAKAPPAGAPAPSPAAVAAAAAEAQEMGTGKKFVLFIDEFTAHPYSRNRLATNVTKMLDRAMKPGDEAMIVRPAETDALTLKFTRDPVLVRIKVDEAMKDANRSHMKAAQREIRQLVLDVSQAGSQMEKKEAARRYADMVRRRVEQRLGNLRSVVTALSELPGRKVVVVVTESMPTEPGREAFSLFSEPPKPAEASGSWAALEPNDAPTDYMIPNDWTNIKALVEDVARTASSAGVTIYTIQPEYGAVYAVPGGTDRREQYADPTRESRGPGKIDPSDTRFMNDVISSTEQTVSLLTEKTGGKWFRGDGQIDDAMRQIASDVLSYYSVAFRASDDVDRPRHLQVRLKNHPELHVRTRDEVVRKSPRNEMTDRAVAGLLYPHQTNELGIAVDAQGPTPDLIRKKYTTTVNVLVPLSKLTFLPEGDVYRARFTIHYAASGASTDFLSGEAKEQVVSIAAADMEKAREKFWRYTAQVYTSEPRVKVTIGVLDSVSRLSGFKTLEVARK
ncbi:MAG TPA: VWA domain-containing protein [Thermoanaerobaculia bacterium]|jgi:VWFA-related protein